jgi:hypothetical protein
LGAAIGSPDTVLQVKGGKYPEDMLSQISVKPGAPLHFKVAHTPGVELMPTGKWIRNRSLADLWFRWGKYFDSD